LTLLLKRESPDSEAARFRFFWAASKVSALIHYAVDAEVEIGAIELEESPK
jgi:hypothetical protein